MNQIHLDSDHRPEGQILRWGAGFALRLRSPSGLRRWWWFARFGDAEKARNRLKRAGFRE